jgi:hypothetical protein
MLETEDWNLVDERMPSIFRVGEFAGDQPRLVRVNKPHDLDSKCFHDQNRTSGAPR